MIRRLRLLGKTTLVALGLADLFGLVEFCGSCGARVEQTWRASPALWSEVTGLVDGGVRCVACFDRECVESGVLVQWVPCVQARRDARGRFVVVARPDPELFPVAARRFSVELPS